MKGQKCTKRIMSLRIFFLLFLSFKCYIHLKGYEFEAGFLMNFMIEGVFLDLKLISFLNNKIYKSRMLHHILKNTLIKMIK